MMKLVNVSEISSTAPVRAGKDQVLFDSGANCCVTNQREDFVGECKHTSGTQTVDGIGKCLKIEGTGHVAWTFVADNGQYRTLKLPCSCVPTMNGRIASMQETLSAYPNERFTMDGNNLVLSRHGAVPGITVPCDKNNQFLPMSLFRNRNVKIHVPRLLL